MANITDYLKQILSARYGRDVRQAIHDGISQCYADGKAGSTDLEARNEIEVLTGRVETAEDIAKGRNQARVFATTEAMYEWLADANNKGVAQKGDNMYIVELDVPDWWIAEVLEEPNANGYYYEIAQLETQKVDLTTIEASIAGILHDWSFNTDAVSRVKFVLQADGSIDIRLFKVDSTGAETGAYVMFSIYPTGLIAYTTVDENGNRTVLWTQTLKNGTNIEDYSFNVSADVTYDEYTVKNTGWAMIHYQFAPSQYSQFALTINNANVFGSNISSGANADGMCGALPVYLQKGDVVRVAYYSTFRMNSVKLRLRY